MIADGDHLQLVAGVGDDLGLKDKGLPVGLDAAAGLGLEDFQMTFFGAQYSELHIYGLQCSKIQTSGVPYSEHIELLQCIEIQIH